MFVQAALFAAQLWLGELTRQRPKRTKFEDFIKDNAPSEIRAIPYGGGTFEVTPPRAWFGDFLQRAVERDSHWTDYLWAGLTAALLDTITVAYRSYIGEMFPLCWGENAHIEQIFIDDRLMFQAVPGTDNAGGRILIDDPQAWGGDQPPGEGGEYAFIDITRGNFTEPPNAYLESLLTTPPNRTPALHGICCAVKLGPSGERESGYFHAGGPGVIPKLKLWKFVLRRQPDGLATGFNKIGRHMNPMETIFEWSTSLEYGAKIPLQYLNLDNWRAVAQQLYDEGNGWSGRIENETSPIAVVKDVLAQIDAVDEPSPSLGLTIRLIRRTYSIGSLRVLNRDNITRVERFAPGTYEDTKNKVQVEFPDQDNNFKGRKALYIDPANQLIQDGRIVPETKSYLGVADFEQANTLTTRDGRAISLPRAPLECFVFPSWGRLTYRGEVVLFEWESPSFSIIMRVLAFTPNGPDEKDYRLVLIEDQFSTGLRTFGEPGPTLFDDPGAGLDTAPPSASWNSADLPPDGLRLTLRLTNTNQFEPVIEGGIIFGTYAVGGQYARIYVTEPGGVQTLSPMRLVPDENNEAIFQWPSQAVGEYEFCVQTFSTRGVTNGVKVCASIDVSAIGSPSTSPSASVSPSSSASPSISPSASLSPSASPSPSASQSPSASVSPSHSASASVSPSISPSGSQSPSSSGSASLSPSSSVSASTSPSASISPSASVSPSSSVSASTSPSSSASPSAAPDTLPVAGAVLWYNAHAENYANNDPMGTLTDQSGNSNNATQSSAGLKGTFVTNAINGLPAYSFDGSDDRYSLASSIADQDWTVYIVLKPAGSGVRTVFGGANATTHASQLRLNTAHKWEWVDSATSVIATSTTALSTSAFSYVTITRSASANGKFRLNGVDDGNTGTHANLVNGMALFGASYVGVPGISEFFQGLIAEFVRFNSKHNSTDIASMESYFTTKYGL